MSADFWKWCVKCIVKFEFLFPPCEVFGIYFYSLSPFQDQFPKADEVALVLYRWREFNITSF